VTRPLAILLTICALGNGIIAWDRCARNMTNADGWPHGPGATCHLDWPDDCARCHLRAERWGP